MYVSDIYEGLVTVDISDRENPVVASSLIIRQYWPDLDIEFKPLAFS